MLTLICTFAVIWIGLDLLFYGIGLFSDRATSRWSVLLVYGVFALALTTLLHIKGIV